MTRRGTRKTAGRTPSARIMLGLAAVAPLVAGAMSVGGVASAGGAVRPAVAQSWPVAGQNISDTRDQAAETAISASNVSQLVPAWTFTTAGDVSATPTVAGNDVYFPDWGGTGYRSGEADKFYAFSLPKA
jgi:polyvinyl alcohol dehydrogenase (cytochrome)